MSAPTSSSSSSSAESTRTLTRQAGVVALGTLGSRVLGALRDAVIAASFALPATDAFFVAWTIPNTLRRVLGEGAVSAAFIPIFSELKEREGEARARSYLQGFYGALLVLLLLASLLGVVFAPELTTLYAGGYRNDPDKFQTTVTLTRLVFPYILFAGLAALWMGVLNAMGRFAVPAFAPALLNAVLIIAPFTFVPLAVGFGMEPVIGLGLASLVGGALQVLAQLPSARQVGMLVAPRLAWADPAVRRSGALIVPLLLGTGVNQLNVLLSRLFASYLPTGSQSYLYYGQRLVEIPQGMFALAVASAALPSLATLRSRGAHDEAKQTFRYSLKLTLFVALPASVGLAALAGPTVTVLFARGSFSAGDAEATAAALVWLAAGVWAVAATHMATRLYYAYGDTRTPVVAAAVNLVVFLGSSLWLLPRLEHEAIALGSTLAAVAQLAWLLGWLPRRVGALGMGDVANSALRSLLASAAMGAVVFDLSRVGHWERGGNDPMNITLYLAVSAFGCLVYLAGARLLKVAEAEDLLRALRRRVERP
jgi:putative peptidoglycan lipid II flippase